jgi:D-serine deaminase-like pyridoxal phosphate-dependent protein
MVAADVPSVVVTSPIVGEVAVARLLALDARAAELIVVVDHADSVRAIDAAAGAAGAQLSVMIDVNVGQNRTGVTGTADVLALAEIIRGCAGLRLRGIQAYYGTLQHIPTYAEREDATLEPRAEIRDIVAAMRDAGLPTEIVSGGGTGTHHIDMHDGVFTEVQVGSYAFLDSQYDAVALHPDDPHPFEDSLFVQGTVVSDNQPGIVVVDCGWKAFATEGKAPQPLDGRTGFRFMGDEHCGLPRQAEGLATLALGDTVIFRPPHCDPTVNLFSAFQCVRDDTLEAIWPIEARGY